MATIPSSLPSSGSCNLSTIDENVIDESASSSNTYDLKTIFQDKEGTNQFDKFLNNIFFRIDAEKFSTLLKDLFKGNPNASDQEIYPELVKRIGETIPGKISVVFRAFEALRKQKAALAEQAGALIQVQAIDGVVEIGTPARLIRPIQEKIPCTGQVFVVNDQERPTDYLQSGFPRPYDHFVPLNEYEDSLNKGRLKSSSVDLVTCFIGLHHIKQEQLKPFIQSIHRVLRGGGSFLLRDHDVATEEMKAMVGAVHTVFNAFDGVPLEENFKETRNFLSLTEWTTLLEGEGFERAGLPQLREGDPTANTMLRFIKKEKPEEKKIKEIQANNQKHFRSLLQTYLTGPEWHNVDVFREYAQFLEDGNKWFDFPYFQHISLLEQVCRKSYQAAGKQHSLTDLLGSDYTAQTVFIAGFMLVEFLLKGSLAIPFSLLASLTGNNNKEIQTAVEKEMAKVAREYGDFIEHTPFYDFAYFEKTRDLWQVFYQNFSKTTAVDFFTAIFYTLELVTKGVISCPVRGTYTAPENKEPEWIHILIKDENDTLIKGKEGQDKKSPVSLGEKEIGRCGDDFDTGSSYKPLQVKRYRHFTKTIKLLAEQKIPLVEIAGQEIIQVKVKLEDKDGRRDKINALKGCRELYHYPILTEEGHEYLQLEIDVDCLHEAIGQIQNSGGEIAYIHDF